MNPPEYNEKDNSLFSLDTFCYSSPQPPSPKYLASTKREHLFGIQYHRAPRPFPKMAPLDIEARYHLLPEHRQSIDEDVQEDERLLSSLDDAHTPAHKLKVFRFNGHATLYTRLLACIFAIISLVLFMCGEAITPFIFGVFCVARQTYVLFWFLLCKFIHIEVTIGAKPSRTILGQAKSPRRSYWSSFLMWTALVIDVAIIVGMFIAVTVTLTERPNWSSPHRSQGLLVGGAVVGYIAL